MRTRRSDRGVAPWIRAGARPALPWPGPVDTITLGDYIRGMIRTQIQLTEEQVRKLKRAAAAQDVTMAEVIRRCIDRSVAEDLPDRAAAYREAGTLVGAF